MVFNGRVVSVKVIAVFLYSEIFGQTLVVKTFLYDIVLERCSVEAPHN